MFQDSRTFFSDAVLDAVSAAVEAGAGDAAGETGFSPPD
jgi:hypothetical protein